MSTWQAVGKSLGEFLIPRRYVYRLVAAIVGAYLGAVVVFARHSLKGTPGLIDETDLALAGLMLVGVLVLWEFTAVRARRAAQTALEEAFARGTRLANAAIDMPSLALRKLRSVPLSAVVVSGLLLATVALLASLACWCALLVHQWLTTGVSSDELMRLLSYGVTPSIATVLILLLAWYHRQLVSLELKGVRDQLDLVRSVLADVRLNHGMAPSEPCVSLQGDDSVKLTPLVMGLPPKDNRGMSGQAKTVLDVIAESPNVDELVALAGVLAVGGSEKAHGVLVEAMRDRYEEMDSSARSAGFTSIVQFYVRQDRESEGVELCEELVKRIADDPQLTDRERAHAYNQMAMLLHYAGDVKKAIQYEEKTLSLAPEDAAYICNQAKSYEAIGDNVKAQELYEKALQIGQNKDADHLFAAARFYLKTGEETRAAELIECLRQVDPRTERILRILSAARLQQQSGT